MKKLWCVLLIGVITVLSACNVAAVSSQPQNTNSAVAAPLQTVETPSKPTLAEITAAALAKKYGDYTAQELGFSASLAVEVSQMTATEADAFVSAYVNKMYDYAEASSFTDERIIQEARTWQKNALSGKIPAKDAELYKLRAKYVMRMKGKTEEEQTEMWEEFNAYAGGFDSVEAYQAWKEAWDASIQPTAEDIAEAEALDAQRQAEKKEQNGGYMGEQNP